MSHQKKIRVVMFADVLRENMDGVTHTLYNIINRIPDSRFEYLFITPFPPSDRSAFRHQLYVCKYVKLPLYDAYPLAIPFFDPKLHKVLEDFQPDIIHFTTPSLLGLYAVRYAMKRNIPLFHTYHTHFMSYVEYYFRYFPGLQQFLTFLAKRITRWFVNRCVNVFVPTEPVKQELVEAGISADRMSIWGRGVDTRKYSPIKRDESYIENLCGAGTRRILFVSRLVGEKEVDTLIATYRTLALKRPDIVMVITGDGPKYAMMKKKMPRAVFTGKLIGEDLARIYASCDLFIFPSITETFGNVVLEALASGLPAVVAAKGGPKGIIRHGHTGLHAQPKNSDDFCDKIITLLDNPELLRQMQKNAIAYANSQNWNDLCNGMFKSYESALNTTGGAMVEAHEMAV